MEQGTARQYHVLNGGFALFAACPDNSTSCFKGGDEKRTMESDTAHKGLESFCAVT